MKLTCYDCNCFKEENPEPIKYDKYRNPIYNGRCMCHGYYLMSNEDICADFER